MFYPFLTHVQYGKTGVEIAYFATKLLMLLRLSKLSRK